MNSTHTPLLTVPLSSQAHALARQFAAEQINPERGKRVYLNTLAVYAVHTYLRWIHIPTDFSQGDSWQPNLQAVLDVADLVIPGLGKLECRPILPGETACTLPPETLDDRIGYVGVQFQDQLDAVQLVGFTPAIAPTTSSPQILLIDFQPLADLAAYLHQLRTKPAIAHSQSHQPATTAVHLGRWLQNCFEEGWQALEDLFTNYDRPPAFNFRSDRLATSLVSPDSLAELPAGVRRGKLIQFAGQPTAQIAALVVWVSASSTSPETSSRDGYDVLLQVYPTPDQRFLPANLQLIVLDETEQPVTDGAGNPLTVRSHQLDNLMQLLLRGKTGEQFRVRLVLGEVSMTETFRI